jgi:hypothetical protein
MRETHWDAGGERRHPGPVEGASANVLRRAQSSAQDTHPETSKGQSPWGVPPSLLRSTVETNLGTEKL